MSSTTISNASTSSHSARFTLKSAAQAVEAGIAKDLTSAVAAVSSATPSSTVTLSLAGVGLLESLGQSAANIAKGGADGAMDVVELPVDVARDVAGGVLDTGEDLAKAGLDLVSGDLGSVAMDAGAAVRGLVADAPGAVISDVATDVKAIASDGARLAGGILGLSTLGVL